METECAMPQQGDQTILDEAKDLLVRGKRFMALEDYQSATDCLEQSCQLFDAYYGVAKRGCADAYLEYGLALVALANLEAGSGSDKIMKKAGIENDDEGEEEDEDDEGEEEEEDEDEDDDEEGEADEDNEGEQVQDAKMIAEGENSNELQLSDVSASGPVNGSLPIDQESQQSVKTNGVTTSKTNEQKLPQASSSSAALEPTPGTSGDTGCEAQDNEDVDNEEATTIEVAWEVLCLAKRLYMTDESLEGRLKLAETLQKIGEISIEWDNNEKAVGILEECLKIRTAILQPDDRLIALTYYNLGLANSFNSDTQSANDNFQNAINVIEKRIASLGAELEKAKAAQDTVAIGSHQKEINELKELLPDMTMRLDDSKEDSTNSTEVLKRTRDEMQQEDDEAKKMCSDKSKPVDDISHLVKRKAA